LAPLVQQQMLAVFFDDGSSIQFFDDGSRLVTDSAGAVSSTPAVDIASAGVQPSGAETFPVAEPSQITVTDLPPSTDGLMPDDSLYVSPGAGFIEVSPAEAGDPLSQRWAATPYRTQAELAEAIQRGEQFGYRMSYDLGNGTMAYSYPGQGPVQPVDVMGSAAQSVNDITQPDAFSFGAEPQQMLSDASGAASTSSASGAAPTPDDLYKQGLITDAQYKELTGAAPVVDKSVAFDPNFKDTPLSTALKDLGSAGIEYAKANPWTTAGIIGGGLALAGAMGEPEQPAEPGDPAKKTYTYGPGAPINRTGLEEMWSAASKIYGGDSGVMKQLGIEEPKFQSSFKPNEAPLLSGQAAGAGKVGLGALGQGFSYTPMGQPKTFDISTLTPEQIVQLQDMVARKKTDGGV
jgi:hypothetical protein